MTPTGTTQHSEELLQSITRKNALEADSTHVKKGKSSERRKEFPTEPYLPAQGSKGEVKVGRSPGSPEEAREHRHGRAAHRAPRPRVCPEHGSTALARERVRSDAHTSAAGFTKVATSGTTGQHCPMTPGPEVPHCSDFLRPLTHAPGSRISRAEQWLTKHFSFFKRKYDRL